MVSQPSPTASRAVITIFAGLAVILTIFRLSYRWRTQRFWWDDTWAACSMLLQIGLLIAFWIRTDVPGVGPLNEPRHTRVVAYWIASESFTMVLWTARMSILYSAIRITPPMMTLRRNAYLCAVLFGLMWAGLMAQKVYICVHQRSWERLPAPQCHLGKTVGILELITDFIADGILVAIPFRLLWGVNMPKNMRKLLFSIFSASLLVTIVSIIHAVFLMGPSGLLEGLTANVECAVSLVVANLAVVVTHVYRLVRNGEDIDHDSYETSAINTTIQHPTRFGIGGLKWLANRAGVKTHISSLRFAKSLNPQTHPNQEMRSGAETTTDSDTPAPSKIYHPLTFATDMSDDCDRDDKPVDNAITWSKDEEMGQSPSPTCNTGT